MKRPSILFLGPVVGYFALLLLTGQAHAVHSLFFGAILLCYFFHVKTRYFILLALPFLIKNLLYDNLRWIPFDFIQPVHVAGPYFLEKALFGVPTAQGPILITAYLVQWRNAFFDLYTGILYSLVDLYPLIAILILWRRRGVEMTWRFATAYFVMNIFAFATYIFFPVAPPWYVQQYGLTPPIHPVVGSSAGLQWFEQLIGISIVSDTYKLNPVVFGAIPSMHVGYACCIAFFVASAVPKKYWSLLALYVISIAFGALYLGHHYMIDVVLGILYPVIAICLTEMVLRPYALRLFYWMEAVFLPSAQPSLWEWVTASRPSRFPLLVERQGRGQEE